MRVNVIISILMSLFACSPDYAIVMPGDPETVVVTETVTETITVTEEVEVEVPIYIEVEVPVNEGEIWIDSFTQHMSVDGIDILGLSTVQVL